MSTSKHLLILVLCTSLLLTLTACGFKLRSQTNLPPEMQTLYLNTDNPYGQFESSLKRTLRTLGITLTESPIRAPLTLNVSNPIQTISNTTAGSSNETRVYTINYAATFSLVDNRGKVILPAQVVRTTRNLTLNANQLLESNNQLNMLTREMQREVIGKMLDRLSSQQVAELLQGKQ